VGAHQTLGKELINIMIYRIPSKVALVLVIFGLVICFSTGMIGMGVFLTIGAVAILFNIMS
jgi:hypothetical protein